MAGRLPKKRAAKKQTKKKATKKRPGARQLVDKILGDIETLIKDDKLKPTVGDYLRLLQYREEMRHDDDPKEIKVTWVDPGEESNSEE